jgi:hypothetical protein
MPSYIDTYVQDGACAGSLICLDMFGHKPVLEAIRATVQVRQRKKLFLM